MRDVTDAMLSTPTWSSQSHCPYVANDSLSHRSDQSAGVTASPNHWWASSWARNIWSVSSSVPEKSSRENIERPWVSIASPGTLAANANPYWSSGYGPNNGSKNATCSAVRSK